MNYLLAITINRTKLSRIVEELILLLGGVMAKAAPRHLHLSVLTVLRPAESAVRRLIAILAHGMVAPARHERAAPVGPIAAGKGERLPSFPLLDPRRKIGAVRKRFPKREPNVRGFDDVEVFAPVAGEPSADDPVGVTCAVRRLIALQRALDDLPRQARRLARALAKTALSIRAMRPGRPPGHRSRWRHPVDAVLADCHELALMALNEPTLVVSPPP